MKIFCFAIICCLLTLSSANAQSNNAKNWSFNSGFNAGGWFGGTGVTPLQPGTNPLITQTLTTQVAYSGDLYFEWLHKNGQSNHIGPDLGIKTKLVWDYFTANNGQSSNNYESLTMNYINVPVLLEYCLSFKNRVTTSHYVPGTSNTQVSVYEHSYGDHIIANTTTTPGGYTQGGIPYSNAIFIYGGPQICYLAKGFHNVNGTEAVITNTNLANSYLGLIGGFCFYQANFNLDISYQHGLSSIYTGQSVMVNGFLFKIGFNFGGRKF